MVALQSINHLILILSKSDTVSIFLKEEFLSLKSNFHHIKQKNLQQGRLICIEAFNIKVYN